MMSATPKILARMEELIAESDKVNKSARLVNGSERGDVEDIYDLRRETYLPWRIKVLNILERSCGKESQHFKHAISDVAGPDHVVFLHLQAALVAAYEDCKGGYLFDKKSLIEAEVFVDFLDQADELIESGYVHAAAVIAGGVLEKHLRSMCDSRGIPTLKENGKHKMMDDLNMELRKNEAYNTLKWRQVTVWAQIRNDAAHRNFEKYDAKDVSDQIKGISAFCADFK